MKLKTTLLLGSFLALFGLMANSLRQGPALPGDLRDAPVSAVSQLGYAGGDVPVPAAGQPVSVHDAAAPDLSGDFPQSCSVITARDYLCSATIIGGNKAITAAHCAEDKGAVKVDLYCGARKAHYTGRLKPEHKDYKFGDLHAENIAKDYGFIVLDRGQTFSAKPLPFGSSGDWPLFSDPAKNYCLMAGWGGAPREDLLELHYGRVNYMVYEKTDGVTNKNVLMLGTNGTNKTGSVTGDSGGTLACWKAGSWYLIGVPVAKGRNNISGAVNVMDWR